MALTIFADCDRPEKRRVGEEAAGEPWRPFLNSKATSGEEN